LTVGAELSDVMVSRRVQDVADSLLAVRLTPSDGGLFL